MAAKRTITEDAGSHPSRTLRVADHRMQMSVRTRFPLLAVQAFARRASVQPTRGAIITVDTTLGSDLTDCSGDGIVIGAAASGSTRTARL
jgi:hypothetical protein